MPADNSHVLIITGASRGIGAATAYLAANRGFRICVNYLRNQSAADKVVAAIRQNGGTAIALQADVSNEAEVARLFDAATSQLGPLTALVNNAGTVER
jgi:NAD(P)-dependent dehydrogenase (short-subunit alcohol dehydrogenase family)